MNKEVIQKAVDMNDEYMLNGFRQYSKGCKYFVESGARLGNGVYKAIAIDRFEQFFTCELDTAYYQHCVDEFSDYDNIKIYEGYSTDAFTILLPQLNKKTFFYLDAHDEGGGSYALHAPLPTYGELDLIKELCSSNKHHILIDDIPVYFPSPPVELEEKLLAINPNYIIERYEGHRIPGYQMAAYLNEED